MKRFYAWRRRRLKSQIDACERKLDQLNNDLSYAHATGEDDTRLLQLRCDVFWRRNDLIDKLFHLPKEAS